MLAARVLGTKKRTSDKHTGGTGWKQKRTSDIKTLGTRDGNKRENSSDKYHRGHEMETKEKFRQINNRGPGPQDGNNSVR